VGDGFSFDLIMGGMLGNEVDFRISIPGERSLIQSGVSVKDAAVLRLWLIDCWGQRKNNLLGIRNVCS